MINYIFGFFFIIGITYSFIKNINISEVMLAASNTSIELIFSIIPVICLWMLEKVDLWTKWQDF